MSYSLLFESKQMEKKEVLHYVLLTQCLHVHTMNAAAFLLATNMLRSGRR